MTLENSEKTAPVNEDTLKNILQRCCAVIITALVIAIVITVFNLVILLQLGLLLSLLYIT